ncbi:MAG: type VI secretion system baseplate subunit TssF [Pirellulaceae bacterium]|jgi:type VI secretion system protein ImpG|nr:type VI secretion system baseplate subunit TssF [Pirellulaceae bacterium]
MTDELLPYYHRELAYIRQLAGEFAAAYPDMAGQLRLSAEPSDDPHVERLIEAFAYVNARTRRKLDDDFPELAEAILGILYPHYLAPVPSSAVVRFRLKPSQADQLVPYTIPRGAVVETQPVDGQPCRFRTAYDVRLEPVVVRQATMRGAPFEGPPVRFAADCQACLRLTLETCSPSVRIGQLQLQPLRFYLRGQWQVLNQLFELLGTHVRGIVIARTPQDDRPVVCGPESLQPVGFAADETLFDYPARSFRGYQLLTEYFAAPEKFRFVDFTGFSDEARTALADTSRAELFIYLDRYVAELESPVTHETFELGCTPIVNLYRQRAQTIQLKHTQAEYHVLPDPRLPWAHEVYSIDRVVATDPAGAAHEFLPFYSVRHAQLRREATRFWYPTRRMVERAGGKEDVGTEVYLTLVDLDFQPTAPGGWYVDIDTTCFNRNVPARLPYGGGQPALQLVPGGPVELLCLTQPTPTRRPPRRHGAIWRLISHLTLNHLSLVNRADGAEPLREILKLYDYVDSDVTRKIIAGVASIDYQRVSGRIGHGGQPAFGRGVEVRLRLDEDSYYGTGAFLFALVLDRFLALYCSLNSFTKIVVGTNKRDVLWTGPRRAGEQILV